MLFRQRVHRLTVYTLFEGTSKRWMILHILLRPSSLLPKTFSWRLSATWLGGSVPARIGASTLLLSYLAISLAAYSSTLQPGQLLVRIGVCSGSPCVTWLMPAGTAYQLEVRPGMEVVTIDGVVASDYDQLPSRPAKQIEVIGSNGQVIRAECEDHPGLRGPIKFSLWLLAGMFSALGAAVILRGPDLPSAWWFAGFAGFTAAAVAVIPASAGPHPPWALVVQVLALIGVGATFFPFVKLLVKNGDGRGWTRALSVIVATGVTIAVGFVVSVLVAPALYEIVRPAMFLYLALSVIGSVWLLSVAAMKPQLAERRQQARIALWGVGLGALPIAVVTLVPIALGFDELIPAIFPS